MIPGLDAGPNLAADRVPPAQKRPRDREHDKAQTRRALTQASAGLFQDKGYKSTTVEDIVQKAGCSRRTFFRYFGSKEDVVFANAGDLLSQFQHALAEPTPGLTRWAQIRLNIANTMLTVSEPSSGIGEIAVAAWLHEPALARRFSQLTADLERCIADIIADERGTDADSDLSAQFMARCATAGYLSALRIHTHTGRNLAGLLQQVDSLLKDETYT